MRLAFYSLFLTLVLLQAHAAPDATIYPVPIQTKESFQNTNSNGNSNENSIRNSSIQKDSLQTTPAPDFNSSYIRHSRKEISAGSTNFGLGSGVGGFDKEKGSKNLVTYHLQRTQHNQDETAQEFGLNLTSNGLLGIDWGFKKFCCFDGWVSDWKPYYKIGAAAFYQPKDQLANVIDYQRYFWQAAIGTGDFLFLDEILRLEIGARIGYPGSHFYAQILYAFPD